MEIPRSVYKSTYSAKEGRLYLVLDREETKFTTIKCPPWLVKVFDEERHEGRLEVRSGIKDALGIQ